VAIVTGAGSSGPGIGTGKAQAVLFAREGAKVALVDLFPDRAEETLEMIESEGGEAFVFAGDVSDEQACESAVAATMERFGGVSILSNNVGVVEDGGQPVHSIDADAWDRHLAINLRSAVMMAKHAIPQMIAGGGGSIINITSVAGQLAHGQPAYGVAKAGLIMLGRDFTFMYGRQGIRANSIAVGHILTPLVGGDTMPTEFREMRRKVGPLGVEGNAWDIGWTAVFLASDEARFIAGQCIAVDGGATTIAPLMAYSPTINDEPPSDDWPTAPSSTEP
jgi:NAD(P)-dependent dehydrogenase (short-subunit alcohol dehydrogenase family)